MVANHPVSVSFCNYNDSVWLWKQTKLQISRRLRSYGVHPVSIHQMVAPSGECLWGEGLVWLIGAVVCVVVAALHSRTICSCQSTVTSCDCTERLVAASLH